MTKNQEIKEELNILFNSFMDILKSNAGVVRRGKIVITQYCSAYDIVKALEQTMEEYNANSEVDDNE